MRGWVLVWAIACKDPTPPEKTSETTDTGTAPTASAPALVAWRAVEPGIVEATGGTVTLTAEVDGDGDLPPLTWSLPGGEGGDARAERVGDGTWSVVIDVPPLSDGGLSLSLRAGDTEWGAFELWVRGEVDGSGFGEGWAPIPRAEPTGQASEICGTFATYSEDGTRWDVVIETQGCTVVAGACPSAGGECQWKTLDPCLEQDHDLVCGTTDHFRTAGVSTTFAVLVDEIAADGGKSSYVFPVSFDEQLESLTASPTIAMSAFGVVLGLNTTKKEPVAPALLGLSAAPTTGHYFDGNKDYAWTAIGGVTPAAVADGGAWAGMFTSSDLALGAGATTWTWSVAPGAVGKPWTVTVASPLPGSGTMTTVRTVQLDDPGFAPMAVTASGQDLDGDGAPELFVEAWSGAADSATWLVLDATDKSDTRPVRRLLGTPAAGFSYAGSEEFPDLFVASSALAAGGGKVRGVRAHPSGDWDGLDLPEELWLSGDQWDIDALLVSDAKEVEAEWTGMIGRPRPARAAPSTGRGVCMLGKCGWVRDESSPGFLSAVIDGATSPDSAEPLAGDLTFVGPSLDDSVLVRTRGLYPDSGEAALPIALFSDGDAELVIGVGSAAVRLPDGAEVKVAGASTVSGAEGPNGERVYLISTPQADGKGGVTHTYQVYAGGEVTELDFGGEPPVAVQLLACSHPGVMIAVAMRTADGGVELGQFDLAASKDGVSWVEGPLPLGAGVVPSTLATAQRLNPSGVVSLRPWTPRADRLVWSESHDTRTGVFADGGPDADGDGFDDMITAGAAELDAALLVLVPSTSECGHETWYLPPGDSLAEMVAGAEVVSTAAQPDCSDLLVPVLGLAAVRDAPDLGVLADASGALVSLLPGATGVLSTEAGLGGYYYWGFALTEHRGIGGGDLTATGSSTVSTVDSTLGIGGSGNVWLRADALGGFDALGLDGATLHNYEPPVGGLPGRQVPSSAVTRRVPSTYHCLAGPLGG